MRHANPHAANAFWQNCLHYDEAPKIKPSMTLEVRMTTVARIQEYGGQKVVIFLLADVAIYSACGYQVRIGRGQECSGQHGPVQHGITCRTQTC